MRKFVSLAFAFGLGAAITFVLTNSKPRPAVITADAPAYIEWFDVNQPVKPESGQSVEIILAVDPSTGEKHISENSRSYPHTLPLWKFRIVRRDGRETFYFGRPANLPE